MGAPSVTLVGFLAAARIFVTFSRSEKTEQCDERHRFHWSRGNEGADITHVSRPTLRIVETDVQLLSRLRNGDEEAFVMLVGRYQQPMLRLARSMVPNQEVAEEAVQDTWMGVVRGIEQFEGRSSFKTWLFRILTNRTRTAGSREHHHAALESLHAVDPARFDAQGQWTDPLDRWTEETDDRLEAAIWAPILKSALDDLPPRQRQVVILRDVEGLSNDEVCNVLGVSSGNQRILLHRGRSRLREILEAELEKG